MRLETFFEKFDLIADAPDAMPRLREIVLELAVRGLLSDRRSSDAAHPTWRAFLASGISNQDISDTAPFLIPDVWRWITLNDVGTSKVRNDTEDELLASFIPMAMIPAEYGAPISWEERKWGQIKKSFTHFADGDVVMAKITPCFENGKSAIIQGLINGVGAGTTELHVFRRASEVILPEYVLIYIKSRGFISRGESVMTGSAGQKRVPRDYFTGSPFPLPPPAEQKRIVAKVDELMACCDRLEAQQAERSEQNAKLAQSALSRFAQAPTPANLAWLFHEQFTIPPADLRKAILTLAVQGKLVPQDSSDEKVKNLLERLSSLPAGVRKVPRPLLPIDPDSLPFELPTSWEWVQAQDLCRPSSLITYGVLKPVWVDVGVPTIRVQDMQNGAIVIDGVGQCSPERAAKFGKTTLEDGDLLIAKDGATLGKTAFVPPSLAGGNITQHVLRFPLTPHVDRVFIRLVIDSPHGQAWMRSETKGVALPGVNVGDFRRMPIPLPPRAEQRRIVAKVAELMALVAELETREAVAHHTSTALLDALVAELTTASEASQSESAPLAAEAAAPYEAPAEATDLHSSPEFIRTALAAEIIHRLCAHDTFGQVKLQKLLYLVEYHFQLPEIDSHPRRFAAGPHDPKLIAQVQKKMAEWEWFQEEPRPGSNGHRYRPLARAGAHGSHFEKLWPTQAPAIRAFIDQMKTWKTERCERFATLYAAWNDLLLWEEPVTDARLIREVLADWNPAKLNIPKGSWIEMLQWMKREGYTPHGFGRATAPRPQPQLF